MTDTKKPGTEYVVLGVKTDEEGGDAIYLPLGAITANNDKQAISKILGADPTPGNYIAIPARSFKARTVSSTTETRVTVG